MWIPAAIGALVATFVPPPAAACSCAGPGPIVFPRDGEIDVPRDAVIVGRFSSLVSLTEVETGVEIEVERTPLDPAWGEWFVARPVALLAPSTRHRVIVDDDEAYFSTGATLASAPEPLPLAAVRLAAWSPVEQEGSCDELWRDDPFDREGRRTYACLDLEAPPRDLVMLSYSFVPLDGGGESAVRWIAPWDDAGVRRWPTLLEAHTCAVRAPPFLPGERWRVAVTAWNSAFDPAGGAALEATVAECDSTESCKACDPDAEGPAPPVGPPGPGVYPGGTVGRAPGCSAARGSPPPDWTIFSGLIAFLLTAARVATVRLRGAARTRSTTALLRPDLRSEHGTDSYRTGFLP